MTERPALDIKELRRLHTGIKGIREWNFSGINEHYSSIDFLLRHTPEILAVLEENGRLQKLNHQWNREAAAIGGLCGSEFVDDPKNVFAHVREMQEARGRFGKEAARLRTELAVKEAEAAKLRQALTGRTISCAACEEMAARVRELEKDKERLEGLEKLLRRGDLQLLQDSGDSENFRGETFTVIDESAHEWEHPTLRESIDAATDAALEESSNGD
jgi:hypothetical protein